MVTQLHMNPVEEPIQLYADSAVICFLEFQRVTTSCGLFIFLSTCCRSVL